MLFVCVFAYNNHDESISHCCSPFSGALVGTYFILVSFCINGKENCRLRKFLPRISHSRAHSAAETPTATIKGTLLLPDATPVNMTRVALNAGEQLTYSRLDGTFAFYNVPPGVHLVDVYSHELMFGQVKIQLLEDSMDAPKCIEYAYPGANKQPIAHPLVLTASASYEYFEQRPGFSIFSLLKNPMLLMMVFSVGLMYLMPKMMENMDPEEQERMRKQMEMQKDPSAMLTNLFGMGEQEPVKPVRRNKRD